MKDREVPDKDAPPPSYSRVVGLGGSWDGHYMEHGQRHPMAMVLHLDGSTFTGSGSDDLADYEVTSGFYNPTTGNFAFLKLYTGQRVSHGVEYRGKLVESDGAFTISGTWHIGQTVHAELTDAFSLTISDSRVPAVVCTSASKTEVDYSYYSYDSTP